VSKIHLPELLPVTLSLVVLAHLIFSRICIGSQLINALNLNLPHWCATFLTPLNLIIYVLCSIITLPHILCVLPTPVCCQFHASAQPLPPAVLALQPPQSGTHYHLASVVLPLQTLSVAFLKLTASSRPTAPPSGSVKCLRFGHWMTLCTLNMHLLTYLLTSHHLDLWDLPRHGNTGDRRSGTGGRHIVLTTNRNSGMYDWTLRVMLMMLMGALKMSDRKMQNWKMTGLNLPDLKMQNWNLTHWHASHFPVLHFQATRWWCHRNRLLVRCTYVRLYNVKVNL